MALQAAKKIKLHGIRQETIHAEAIVYPFVVAGKTQLCTRLAPGQIHTKERALEFIQKK